MNKIDKPTVPGIVYEFIEPIEGAGGTSITEIFIRRPAGVDMREMPLPGDPASVDKKIKFFSGLTELPMKSFDEMLGDDFDMLDEAIGDMMMEGKSRKAQNGVLKLLYPTADLSQVTVRRPRAKDYKLRPVNPQSAGDTYAYMASLAGIEEQVIDGLDAADIVAITAVVEGGKEKKKSRYRKIS